MSCNLEIYSRVDDVDFDFYNQHFTTFSGIQFIEDLKSTSTPFSYIRLGDAEWRLILTGSGNQEHEAIGHLDIALEDVLKAEPDYMISFSFKLFRTEHIHDLAVAWINGNGLTNLKFVQDDILSEITRYAVDAYVQFIGDILRDNTRKMVLVGNTNLDHINPFNPVTNEGMFEPDFKINVPKRNCYTDYARIKSEVIGYINANPTEQILFFFSMGPVAPVLIHDLHTNEGYGGQHWFIDTGSFFDIFAGFASRTPSICLKEDIHANYLPCFLPSMPDVSQIRDISPSLM